jgi:hypothetical protein
MQNGKPWYKSRIAAICWWALSAVFLVHFVLLPLLSVSSGGREAKTVIIAEGICKALRWYCLDLGRFPEETRWLGQLISPPRLPGAPVSRREPYFDLGGADELSDAWGRPFRYRVVHGRDVTACEVSSAGSDGRFGTQDDILLAVLAPQNDKAAAR